MRNRGFVVWAAAGVVVAAVTLNVGRPAAQTAGTVGGAEQGGRGRGSDPAGQGRGGRGAADAFPQRPPADPAALERGKALYSVNCQFCHGADTRGGDSGPSLLRSQLVMDDRHGELIVDVVRNGRPSRMPKFDFSTDQVADIAAFLHSFTINSRDPARVRPETIVIGDATAGDAYFEAKCASCHSVTGDLKGLAARFPDARSLQQWWLIPGGGGRGGGGRGGRGADMTRAATLRPVTATISLPGGQTFEGRLVRIDEFAVSVIDADGTTRSFQRDGETPHVEVHDALAPHKELLRTYSDKDIHDVTAYLVKLP